MERRALAAEAMLRTFLDSGVLVAAYRGQEADRDTALSILADPNRTFVASPFLYMEVIPKTVFNRRHLERAFYEKYFRQTEWIKDVAELAAVAQREAEKAGLAAMDALHLAAAHLARADELITTEKSTKPIHRCKLIKVVYLYENPRSD